MARASVLSSLQQVFEKKTLMQGPDNHGFGRERGGWGSKLHLVVDGNGVPLSALITLGQRNESTVFEQAMDGEKIGRKKRPKAVAGDKGYDAKR
ncbi:MAG: transposase, partial [Pseudomonadales bacterium]|nr:transposase [Pseudomonadales bacterium]